MTVTTAPMPAGTIIPISRLPRPSTNGVYRPRGISSVEKLIPGAITLSARQNPQKMYHPKFGVIVTENRFREISNARMMAKATTSAIQQPFGRPCSPASRNKDGSIPVISPINRQTDGSGYFSRKNARIFATPRKPMAPPTMTGSSFGTWVLNRLNGLPRSSMTGL